MNMGIMAGRLAAIFSGISAIAVSTWMNIEAENGRTLIPSDLLRAEIWSSSSAAIVVVAICTTAALAFAGVAWRWRLWGIAAGLFFAFAGGVFYDFTTSLERVAMGNDAQRHERRVDNDAIMRADTAIARAKEALQDAKAGMAAECAGRDPATLDRKGWPACTGHWDALTIAGEELAAAAAKRDALGTVKDENPGGAAVAALLSLDQKQWDKYEGARLPLLLSLFGNLLVALGFAAPGSVAVARPTVEAQIVDVTPRPAVLPGLKPGEVANNQEVARLLGVSESTASRVTTRLAQAGKVRRWRDGKQTLIAVV